MSFKMSFYKLKCLSEQPLETSSFKYLGMEVVSLHLGSTLVAGGSVICLLIHLFSFLSA
jgi:hypothetical protein